jgi:predicted P-loop ATPase
MTRTLIPFPGQDGPDADAHARSETERKRMLYSWADGVLRALGLADKMAQANSSDDLRKITFDIDDVAVELAIRDALHPAGGQRAAHFIGMKSGALKRLLKARFNDMKKDRETKLRGGRSGTGGQQAPHWTDFIKFSAKGEVRPILANLILYLREHPAWKGVLGFDEFASRVVIRKRPYWGDEAPDMAWTDHHESSVRVWFQNEDIAANLGDSGRAVQAAARSNPFHPVKGFLDALVWDGKARLETWLVDYFHADNTPYTRAIGPRILIGGVARIYQPGAKVDHVPVFEGPQGKQKSEALRTLAVNDAWFTDRLSNVTNKDAAIETAGVWIIEIAEGEALFRATASSMKAFVTRRYDRFRPPFGKHPVNRPRSCIFVATINPPAGGYLRDPSGNRRIWPVACHGQIDRDGIERDRDQLWAEAVVRFKAGDKWWLETPALEALAAREQAARYKADAWQESIAQWLGDRPETSVAEVLEHVLGLSPREQNRSAEMRVVNVLTNLGFVKYRPARGGARPWRYRREESTQQVQTVWTKKEYAP